MKIEIINTIACYILYKLQDFTALTTRKGLSGVENYYPSAIRFYNLNELNDELKC